MCTERRRAIRDPGHACCALLVAAALCAQGCASAPPTPGMEQVLLERRPLAARERVEQAEAVLHEERMARLERVHQRAVEAGWRVFQNGSPLRILRGVRKIGHTIWRLRERGEAEDIALDWLERGLDDPADPRLVPLYEQLRARERGQLAQAQRKAARTAIDEDRLEIARYQLERARMLEPGSAATAEELARLDERALLEASAQPDLEIAAGDGARASALLTGDYGAMEPADPADPQARFAGAAARLLAGDRPAALAVFAELAERPDFLGTLAARWLERPEVDVQGDFERAVHEYRIKRFLGWIGGNALADRGSGLNDFSVKAWSESLTPANIGVSLPARVLRGWKPDPGHVREAAVRVLDLDPQGPSAQLARSWLDQVGWPALDANGFQSLPLPLPSVHEAQASLAPLPVIVSRRVVDSELVSGSPALRSALEGVNAVELEARRPTGNETDVDADLDGFALTREEARRLLDELALAIDQGALRWSLSSREAALERLRRLDDALTQGRWLFARGWVPPASGAWSSFMTTLIDGKEKPGPIAMERGEDDLVIARTLGDQVRPCPKGELCLDRDGLIRTTLYGYADADSGVGFGFQSSTGFVGLSLGVTQDGPDVSLILPFGRWLGIDRWLPIEAEFSVSGASVYAGPVLRKRRCSETPDPENASARQLLPLGLRSRCVMRLY